jgi:hypothetical protein
MTREQSTGYVVVATASRPWLVVCGREVDRTEELITLEGARCAVYYSRDTRSLLGLATIGPQAGSRITPPCERITVRYETVIDCTPAALTQWESEPWG